MAALEETVQTSLNNIIKEDPELVSIIQTGASLTEDYVEGVSDIDFTIISRNPDKYDNSHPVVRCPKQFLRRLKLGHSFELAALKFGKIHHDLGFISNIDKSLYKPTKITIQDYMMSAINQYSRALENYFSSFLEPEDNGIFDKDVLGAYVGQVINCSYKSIKACCKILATRATNEIYETFNEIKQIVSKFDVKLAEKLSFLYDIRKEWKNNLKKLPSKDKIYDTDSGRFILEAEEVLRDAFEKEGYSLPKFNDIIPPNTKEIDLAKVEHRFLENIIDYHLYYENGDGKRDSVEMPIKKKIL